MSEVPEVKRPDGAIDVPKEQLALALRQFDDQLENGGISLSIWRDHPSGPHLMLLTMTPLPGFPEAWRSVRVWEDSNKRVHRMDHEGAGPDSVIHSKRL